MDEQPSRLKRDNIYISDFDMAVKKQDKAINSEASGAKYDEFLRKKSHPVFTSFGVMPEPENDL